MVTLTILESLAANKPAPDFSDPLGLLKACHQRISGFCDLLQKVVTHLEEHGLDDDARQAIRKIHHYFSTAGKLHHQDEEQDLFPMLTEQSVKVAEIIRHLKQDHQQLDKAWDQLEPLLSKPASIENKPDFTTKVNSLCEAYREHIKKEEDNLLSIAGHILTSEQLRELGRQMKKRRETT